MTPPQTCKQEETGLKMNIMTNFPNHAKYPPLAQVLLLLYLPSIENSYSLLGPQTSIGVIITNKGKEMCWWSEYNRYT